MEPTTEFCKKLWGGRFSKHIDPEFHNLNASIDIDKRMYSEDIQGSVAYAKAIHKANLLTDNELETIINGLEKVRNEWNGNRFIVIDEDEDIHSANERRLSEIIGDAGKKLHTGRSRNDQTLTDIKLWLRTAIDELLIKVKDLIEVLVTRADQERSILMPGYTHLQRAQPVKWSHWLLSHAWSMKADFERLEETRKRINILPLGSGAIAGNPFPIDRRSLAKDLGFEGVTLNSMYAVGDRDFVAEFLFWSSLTSIHLSRLSEDLIIYSSEEFGFVRFADEFSTGSSLMPQKRNPDCMELVRGKTGTLLGKCTGFMATLKGIPSTYNKDLQEDKDALFSTFDTIKSMIHVTARAVESLTVSGKRCNRALTDGMLATDVAYYLVRKGIPFREAHHLAGRVVSLAEIKKTSLWKLSLEELRTISEKFEKDIDLIWDFDVSSEQYKIIGGTSSSAIDQQIDLLRSWSARIRNDLHSIH